MRKKFLLLLMALSLMPCALFAQHDKSKTIVEETVTDSMTIITTTVVEKEIFFTNGFWHNWELSTGIGPQFYLGDNDYKVKHYYELITPTIDMLLTKWASPSIGISFGTSISKFKGLYQSEDDGTITWYQANFKTDEFYTDNDPIWDYQKLKRQKGLFMELFALAHVDIRNLIGGYDPSRFYTVNMFIGGGVMFGFDKGGTVKSGAFNAGIINKFRITDYFRLMLCVRGALVADDFDGELYVQETNWENRKANYKMDGEFGITAGVAFYIDKQKSQWRPASRTTEIVHRSDLGGKTDTIVIREVDTITKTTIPEFWFHIVFQVDKWDISNKEKVNLRAIADAIKSTPGVRYLVCGYADMQTASPEHNLMLSQKRSRAVFDFLIDECGVDPETLVLDYKGGVDYMFYQEKELSRCVLITTIKE